MKTKSVFQLFFSLSFLVFLTSFYLQYQFASVAALHSSIFFLALFFLYEEGLVFKKLGIPGKLKTNVLYTVAGLIAVFVAVFLMSIAFSLLGVNDHQKVVEIAQSLPLHVLAIAVLLAPISEELFFRGFLCSRFGVLASSIVFALFHFAYGSVVEVSGAFLTGIILGLLFKRSGSIIPCILVHMIYNLVSIAVLRGFA